MSKAVLSCVLANTVYASAIVWYAYITHLGYRGNSVSFIRSVFRRCYSTYNSFAISRKHPSVLMVSCIVRSFPLDHINDSPHRRTQIQPDAHLDVFPFRVNCRKRYELFSSMRNGITT